MLRLSLVLTVALVAAALGDTIVEWLANSGLFSGGYADGDQRSVVPTLLCAGVLGLQLVSARAFAMLRGKTPASARDVVLATARRLSRRSLLRDLPAIGVLQLAGVYAMESAEAGIARRRRRGRAGMARRTGDLRARPSCRRLRPVHLGRRRPVARTRRAHAPRSCCACSRAVTIATLARRRSWCAARIRRSSLPPAWPSANGASAPRRSSSRPPNRTRRDARRPGRKKMQIWNCARGAFMLFTIVAVVMTSSRHRSRR